MAIELELPDRLDEKRKTEQAFSMVLPERFDPVISVNARAAAETNPEEFAKVKRVADRLGVPASVVATDFAAFDTEQKVRDTQMRLATDPFYAERMRNPNFAKLSQGDEENLGMVRQSISVLGRAVGQLFIGGPANLAAQIGFDASGVAFDLAARGAELTRVPPNVAATLDREARNARYMAERARSSVEYFFGAKKDEGHEIRGLLSGMQSAGQMLMAAPLASRIAIETSVAQASQWLAGVFAGGVGAQAYTEMKQKGGTTAQAITYAVPHAAFEYVFEVASARTLLAGMAAKTGVLQFAKELLKKEIPSEQLTTITQDFNEWMNLNPDNSLKDFLTERPGAAYETLIATIVGGSVQAGGIRLAQRAVDRAHRDEDMTRETVEGLKTLLDATNASLLKSRHVPTFAELVAAAGGESQVEAVYMNAATFAQSAAESGLDIATAMPETAAALEDAVSTNSDVRIPLAEFAANAELFQPGIVEELKLDPNGATQRELADTKWVEETRQKVEKLLTEHQFTDSWKQSADVVKNTIKQQLVAAGRFTNDVNEAYASFVSGFYSTQAHRIGVTPEEMYTRYPLRVQATKATGETVLAQPASVAQNAARAYVESRGGVYRPAPKVPRVDAGRAVRIAQAYEEMKHDPQNPEVQAAYKAMIDETLAQWQVIKATGLKVEFIKDGQPDPYAASPRMAIEDVANNNHLWVFPTDQGFGSDNTDVSDNPLLAPTAEVVDGRTLLANDVFRIVHDYFGHIKDNNGFRAAGEENAWRSHAAMYSPLARRAMTSETRGQNSWVNFGPYGEKNRTAKSADTVYATQKTGLLPEWVSEEGSFDATETLNSKPVPEYGRIVPNSVSAVAVHFSPSGSLENLLSSKYGTGMKGAERGRVMASKDARLKQRIHFYLPMGKGVTAEKDVGTHAYVARLNNLYDASADPLNLAGKDLETKVLDAGFDGYMTRDFFGGQGAVVLLGSHNVPVTYFGSEREVNAALASTAPPAPVKSDKRVLAERLIKAEGLPYGQLTPSQWREALAAKQPDLLADLPASVFLGTEPVYRDQLARTFYQEPGLFNQGEVSSEWYYSELARQIELLNMKQGTGKAWKDAIKGLVAKGVVKPAEVEAVGINEWLEVAGANRNVGFWELVKADGTVAPAGLYTSEASAKKAVENPMNGAASARQIVAGERKLTRDEVVKFVADHGVQLEEQLLTENGSEGVEYIEGDWEVDDPGSDYFRERAQERIDEMSDEEKAEELGVEVDELDDESDSVLRVRFFDQEREYFHEDSESPQTMTVTVSGNGDNYDYQVSRAYGEVAVYDPFGKLIASGSERRTNIQDAVMEHARENYSEIFSNGSEAAEYGNEDYRLEGRNEGYIELKLILPGARRFRSNHFPDTGSDNIVVHFRADTRKDVDGKRVLFVEEVQSDWAQAGRDEGFTDGRKVSTDGWTAKEIGELSWQVVDAQGNVISADEAAQTAEGAMQTVANRLNRLKANSAIEPGPFVTNTDAVHTLAWKRIVRYAAENGFDRVAWTRGDQQVERWSGALRKRVDSIEWVKTEQGVHILGFKKSNAAFSQDQRVEKVVDTTYAESALSDAIGKAMGKQILEDPNQSGKIEGGGITIDSVGMAAVYGDENGLRGTGQPAILTKTANAVLKKFGGGKVVAVDMGFGAAAVRFNVTGRDYTREEMVSRSEELNAEGTVRSVKASDDILLVVKAMGRFSTLQAYFNNYPGNDPSEFTQHFPGIVVEKIEPPTPKQPGFDMTPELKAKALAGLPLFQGNRGQISFGADIKEQPSVITLLANADLSTFLHETGHFYLEVLADMASQVNAPADIVADFNTVMQWFGVKLTDDRTPLEMWHSMTLEEKRPYHEQWARGIEAYLFEGKAPTPNLQSLFGRFRAWLINVYEKISALNVTLTPEVRQVMGRLVAANEEILQAESDFAAIYDTKPEGMTDVEWADYQVLGGAGTQEAVDQLQTRSLRDMQFASNAKSAALKKLQRQAAALRKTVRAEVAAEVEAEPIYRALAWLKTGYLDGEKTTGGKLSIPAMKEMYGDEPAAPWRYLPTNVVSAEGLDGALHPDFVAELFGFSSGDELVRTLLDTEPAREKIDGITDQRMLERHGDLSDPASVERAADAAVHNEVRARFVATELRMLDKATGDRGILMTLAKNFAAEIVARKKIRLIKPGIHSAAEQKAARNAKAAVLAGDTKTAAGEKRNQLVNLYAARASHDAIDEVNKAVSYLKRVGESKTVDPEYREQIQALLERFDLRKVSARDTARRESLVQWIEAQKAKDAEPVIDADLVNEAYRKPYQEMTLEEFRGLVDSVRNIEHLGRLKHKLLVMADKRAFAAVESEAAASIVANAKTTVPSVEWTNKTLAEKAGSVGREVFAFHTKLSSFMRQFDGWRDNGIMQRLFVHSSNAAGATEALLHEQAAVRFAELLKPIKKMNEKTFIPELKRSLSREARIMVALNTGTEGNLQRLLDGDHWTPAQVQAVLDTLTKTEMDFVQGVWDFIGEYRDQVGAQQKRLTGVAPKWIEPRPVKTKHGEYRGGYIPAKYDGTRSTRALSDEASAALFDQWRAARGAAKTRDSFTKARADKVVDRPLRKDFGVITQHITEVTHRLAWQEWVVDASRLLRSNKVDGAIREHYGNEVLESLREAVKDIATGPVGAQNWLERAVNHVRTGATVAGLGWKLSTALLQFTGATQSIVRIGPKWFGKGMAQFLGDAVHMESAAAKVAAKSEVMRLRAKTMQREISEIQDQVKGEGGAIKASFFYLIQKAQMLVDVPTWLGAYEKALATSGIPDATKREANAIAQADQAVKDAQGGGQIHDLPAALRGGPLLKLFTNFASFFVGTTFQLTRESFGRTNFKSAASIAMLGIDFLLLYSIPAALGTLMKYALSDDDDEDKLIRNLIADQISYLTGTMIGLRELAGAGRIAAGMPADYAGPAGLRVLSELYKLGKQTGQGELDEPFWKALNNSAGILFHYPAGAVNNFVDGIVALANGKTSNPGVMVVGSSQR